MHQISKKNALRIIYVTGLIGLLISLHCLLSPAINYVLIDRSGRHDRRGILTCLLLGADVNTQSEETMTPLMIESFSGDTENVKLLLFFGAHPNVTDKWGRNALTVAQKPAIVSLLRKAGANDGMPHHIW